MGSSSLGASALTPDESPTADLENTWSAPTNTLGRRGVTYRRGVAAEFNR